MSAAEKKTVFRIATASANNSNSTKSDITQKLKQGNILWKIAMKIPVIRPYYSLACVVKLTENVDLICQTKQREGGVFRRIKMNFMNIKKVTVGSRGRVSYCYWQPV